MFKPHHFAITNKLRGDIWWSCIVVCLHINISCCRRDEGIVVDEDSERMILASNGHIEECVPPRWDQGEHLLDVIDRLWIEKTFGCGLAIEAATLYTKPSVESVAFKDYTISSQHWVQVVKIWQLAIYVEQSQDFALRYPICWWSSQWWRKASWDIEDKKYAFNKVSKERFEWLTLFFRCRVHSNSRWVLICLQSETNQKKIDFETQTQWSYIDLHGKPWI